MVPDEQVVRQSAEEAFERVMASVPGQPDTMPADLEPADALRWVGDRVTELLAGFAELPLDRLLGLDDHRATDHDHDHDHGRDRDLGRDRDRDPSPGSGPPIGESVRVCVAPGEVAEVRVWVHLIGEVPVATLRFILTDLLAETGERLRAQAAQFEPSVLTLPVPAGASTVLRLPVPEHQPAGSFQGLVVGQGFAAAVVPITVVVG